MTGDHFHGGPALENSVSSIDHLDSGDKAARTETRDKMSEPAEIDPLRERELFEQAFDLDPASRAAFLEKACGDNLPLYSAVKDLLAAADHATRNPAWELPALHHEAAAAAETFAPSSLDRYEILDRIGAGGMGGLPGLA